LTATAAAQRQGLIGDEHVRVIRSFFAHLPAEVDPCTRDAADADLAGKASQYRPDELAKYAEPIMDWLNPDAELSDQERARKRGITTGTPEYDRMSRISGYLTRKRAPPPTQHHLSSLRSRHTGLKHPAMAQGWARALVRGSTGHQTCRGS